MENNILSSLFLMLVPFFLLHIYRKYYTSETNLPPGPRRLPIIGNIHQIGKKPHVSTANFAQEYGPLISLRLGSQIVVVAYSPDDAMGILKTHDLSLSGRAMPDAYQQSFSDYFFDYNEHWKSLRTLCRAELFSSKALEVQSSLRNKKLSRMLDFLHNKLGKVVAIEEVLFSTLFNTLSNVLFGKDLLDLNDEHGAAHGLKSSLVKVLENSITPNVSDFFPVIAGLDLQGLRKDSLKGFNAFAKSIEGIIKERRARIDASTTKNTVAVESKDLWID